MPSCCTRFCKELSPCQTDWFYLSEKGDGSSLDVIESFQRTTLIVRVGKLLLTLFVAASFVSDWIQYDVNSFFLAYFTRWSTLLLLIYQLVSLSHSFPGPSDDGNEVTRGVKLTWILFNAAIHCNLLASVLFWYLVYKPDRELEFWDISTHGVCLLCSAIDGFVLNRVPIRLYHWWLAVLPVDAGYCFWSFIHSLTDIGNPVRDEDDENPDLIYDALDWNDAATGTFILVLLVVFVAGPVFQLLLWFVSLPARRYVSGAQSMKNEDLDV